MSLPERDGARALAAVIVGGDSAVRCRLRTAVQTVMPDAVELDDPASIGVGNAANDRAIVVVDLDTLAPSGRRAVAAAMRDSNHRFIIRSAGSPELANLYEAGLCHVVANNGPDDIGDLVPTVEKIARGPIFGLARYFSPDAPSGIAPLTDSALREDVLVAVQRFAEDQGASRRLVGLFTTLTDELVTNALYNAPVDNDGTRRFANLSRTCRVALDPSEAIEVHWRADQGRLGVAVVDPFGSLGAAQLQGYLSAYFRSGQHSPRRGPGGAKLGLLQAFGAASQFICNLGHEPRTEVIGLIDLEGSFRSFVARAKSFHIFTERPDRGRRTPIGQAHNRG